MIEPQEAKIDAIGEDEQRFIPSFYLIIKYLL